MGRIGFESLLDSKSQLVLEICSISTTNPIACSHRHHIEHLVKSPFIDWLQKMPESELIKRRYHKLALQLHPDKNKHPKADVAFKLVSECFVAGIFMSFRQCKEKSIQLREVETRLH
ncbi:hypothetical protein V6Z11_D01G027900 [Gossypium hirsutum]